METIIEGLAQYGPLGLWTASLLWMNHQQRKDQANAAKDAREQMEHCQANIVHALSEHSRMLDKALDKLDFGLDAMKEKYAEDRMLRMKDKP
jgi:Flp pilus assembly protein TadB